MAKPNKSKRLRQTVLVAKINVEESGIIVPEHIKKLKNPRKHFRLEEYKRKVNQIKNNINNLEHAINNAKKSDHPIPDKVVNDLLVFNYKSAVIDYFIVLDEMVNSILNQHQFEKNQNPEFNRHFSKIDDGLNEFLPAKNRSKEFDKIYTRIKFFRTLRNQFAHYSYGAFVLNAVEESFESFLESLKGIEFQTPKGFHSYVDGKPGMLLPYNFTSGEFLFSLINDGNEFYEALLDIFFPE